MVLPLLKAFKPTPFPLLKDLLSLSLITCCPMPLELSSPPTLLGAEDLLYWWKVPTPPAEAKPLRLESLFLAWRVLLLCLFLSGDKCLSSVDLSRKYCFSNFCANCCSMALPSSSPPEESESKKLLILACPACFPDLVRIREGENSL